MSELSETQRNLNKLMNDYEMAVIGENRGRNLSGYSEKEDKYYQKRRELKEFVAELEAECDRAKAIVSRLRDFLFDYTNLKISNSQDDRWWALVNKFDELTTESEK